MKESLENASTVKVVPRKSSFTVVIQSEVPVETWLLAFKNYDRSTDPEDHLAQFQSTMILHSFSDSIYYETFPTTLRGTTRTWFNQLLDGTITLFK